MVPFEIELLRLQVSQDVEMQLVSYKREVQEAEQAWEDPLGKIPWGRSLGSSMGT